MQGTEIIDAMLVLLRKKPKITNKEISLNLRLHRNTVSKYRKIIRQTYYKTPEEIVNKIDSKLEEDLEAMVHRDLIAYRRVITPQKIEAKTEIREIKLLWEIKDEHTHTKDTVSATQRAAELSREQS